MVSLKELLGRFITNYYYLIILVAVLLLFLALGSAQNMTKASGIETQTFTYTELYKDINFYNYNYNATSGQFTFLILVTTDNVYDPNVLRSIAHLENAIRGVKKISKVWSISDYVNDGNADTFNSTAGVEQKAALLPPGLVRSMVVDRHHALIYVMSRSNIDPGDKASILQDVRNTISFTPMPVGTSAIVTGTAAKELDIQTEIGKSMPTLLLTSIGLMLIALWFTFSRARWRLLPLPIVIIGIIYTAGIMAAAKIPLTFVSMAVFPILIGLGVEYAIQFHNRTMEELESGKKTRDAFIDSVKGITPPVLFSIICTILGFYSILSSPVPMVYDFGRMAIIGVVVCFLTALFLLMSVLFVLARRSHFAVKEQKSSALEKIMGGVGSIATRHPETIIIATIAMFLGFAVDASIGVDVNTANYVPQDLPTIVNFRSLSYAESVKTGDLMVIIKGGDVTRPDVVRWMQDFANLEQRNNPDVLAVNSLATQIAASNNGTLPQTPGGIQEIIDAMPPGILNTYVDDFRSTAVIMFTINTADTPHLMSMLDRVQSDLKFLWPPAGITATLSGEQMSTKMMMLSVTGDRLAMTMEAGLLVFLGLFVIHRNWVKAFVPSFTVIIISGLNCLVMFLMNMLYTPLSVTLGSVIIGVGVDFSILLMERYYEERGKGHLPMDAMHIAAGKIGSAIFCSASTVIAGFAALVISSFSILSNFGIIAIIGFFMALCGAFMILPPMLVILDTWQSKASHKEAIPSHG